MTTWKEYIALALKEDIGSGDHSSNSCIPFEAMGKAKLLVKEPCVLAGIEVALEVFKQVDSSLKVQVFRQDGHQSSVGDIAFELEGKARSIVQGERLALNYLQRMSGIATVTAKYTEAMKGTKCKVLDTRKTTPNNRFFEKWAVRIGGGTNHRFGLYDMIMIKDNHIDFAGGIPQAVALCKSYLTEKKLDIPIEIEARNLHEVQAILNEKGILRILLDNFSVEQTSKAVALIDGRCQSESSGGITLSNCRDYALCGVDFVSVGALTHQIYSVDLSLKAKF